MSSASAARPVPAPTSARRDTPTGSMGDGQTTAPHRLAVVGCGQWGVNVARVFADIGVLEAVVDENPQQAEAASRASGAESLSWPETLARKTIDAVAIVTPPATHAQLAVEALEAGKHVFVEKPLALSVADGERIRRAAGKAGRAALVGHVFRQHPAFVALKALCDEGRLGRLHHIYCTRLNLGRMRREDSVLWSLAPHDISMLLAVTGEQPTRVDAHGSCHLRPRIADAVTAHLVFPSGIHAQVSVSWMYPTKERRVVVVGDEGMAVFDDGQPWDSKLLVYRHRVKKGAHGEPLAIRGQARQVGLAPCEPLHIECQHFLDSISNGQKSGIDVEEGISVLRVLAAMDKSLSRGPERRPLPPKLPLQGSVASGHVHESAVVDGDAQVGSGTRIWHFSHVMSGARIGQDCILGQNVFIDRDVTIGNRCKIQNNVSVYHRVFLEDGVFCGPSSVFTNVLTPRAEIERKSAMSATWVRRGATIGANATIICGIELGEYSMVGAGAVVTKSVAPHALVVGNPARRVGWVSAAGERLGRDLVCPRTGDMYVASEDGGRLYALDSHQSGGTAIMVDGASTTEQVSQTKTPFVDLKSQMSVIRSALDRRLGKVFDEASFIMGPEVRALEAELGRCAGVDNVISCGSGTDGLMLSLMALGLAPGDAVLVPTFSFVATVEPIVLLGGVPIFVDVEPDTFTLDPSLIGAGMEAAQRTGRKVVGIVAVDIFGHPADYTAIMAAARQQKLWVVADAAQSFGASIDGRQVGSLADMTVTSFFPSKPLGCYGDGGAVFTNDARRAETLKCLGQHGRGHDKFDSIRVGMNSRLDTIQAAVLLAKLDIFDAELARRQANAATYSSLLKTKHVIAPKVRRGCSCSWASYTIRVTKDRDSVRDRLQKEGYPTVIYYPKPIHTMEPYRHFPVIKGNCPVAEAIGSQLLSLPIHAHLGSVHQHQIAQIVNGLDSRDKEGCTRT